MNSGPMQPFTSEPVARRGGSTSKSAPTLFDLEPVARSRKGDPWTSREAGRSVKHITETQGRLIGILRHWGDGLTDEELWQEWEATYDRPISPSGLRTRRRELERLEVIEDSGWTRPTKAGRKSIVWRLRRGST